MMEEGPKKIVVITGVSRGLGNALAVELVRRGHNIIGCARNKDNLTTLHTFLDHIRFGSNYLTALDIRSDGQVKMLAKLLQDKGVVPDIIVNNAGIINRGNNLWDISAEEFSTVIDTNVKGVANVIRHFMPLMLEKKQGIIVNMSSGWGRSGAAEVAPYCASKWAIEGLSCSVAREVPAGMAVVALSPGLVNTDMLYSCFGAVAGMYPTPEEWAPRAADMILKLTEADNGASLTVE